VGVLPRDLAVSGSLPAGRLPVEDPHLKFHGPRECALKQQEVG
jgi:hypothetical protein